MGTAPSSINLFLTLAKKREKGKKKNSKIRLNRGLLGGLSNMEVDHLEEKIGLLLNNVQNKVSGREKDKVSALVAIRLVTSSIQALSSAEEDDSSGLIFSPFFFFFPFFSFFFLRAPVYFFRDFLNVMKLQ
jgi:hypothetical protein